MPPKKPGNMAQIPAHGSAKQARAAVDLAKETGKARVQIVAMIVEGVVKVAYAGAIAFGLWMARDIASALAGKTTVAMLNGIVDVKVTEALAWSLAAIFSVGWGRERVLRRRNVGELSEHARELELRLDPHRSSSNPAQLSPKGKKGTNEP
jgi:hypothetical protein